MALADKKHVGQILCKNGIISSAQLRMAIAKQKTCGNRALGVVLIDMGYITPGQLCDALSGRKKCKAVISK